MLFFLLPINFPNSSSLTESTSVYARYLKPHFSLSQPKALLSKAFGYLSKFCRASCPEVSQFSFCSSFTSIGYLAATAKYTSSTATGPDRVRYPMLKHLLCSGMNLLLYIFSLCWPMLFFPLPRSLLLLLPFTKRENLSTYLFAFGLSSHLLCPKAVRKCHTIPFTLFSGV